MIDTLTPCTTTIPLWEALLRGADDACIALSAPSVLSLLVPFVMGVVALQWLVKRMLFGAPKGRRDVPPARSAGPRLGQRRATGRWGTGGPVAPDDPAHR